MLTPEQLAARKIGGSDIGTILGLNPWSTPLDLYRQMIGEAPGFEENDATQAGNVMEPAIAELYELRSGRKVRRSNITHTHPVHDFLTAHLDRVVVGEKRGVEIKNVGRNMVRYWGESGSDEVPPYYLAQVHHYMLVVDYPAWDVAAYFGGGDIGIFPVERSEAWDDMIIDGARAFWECVQTRTPPKFDPTHPAAMSALKRIYPGTDGSTVEGDETMLAWSTVERDSSEHAKHYDEICDGAKAHLLDFMGEASVLKLPDGSSYTRKTIQRKAFEVEATEYVQLKFVKAKS